MASCPLHTDHTPSLSVTWRDSTQAGRGGAVLLHCFSCQAAAADIAAALGMRLADLFDNPVSPAGPGASVQHRRAAGQGKLTRRAGARGPLPARITLTRDQPEHVWRRVRVYTYTAIDGTPVQQVIRQECRCNGQPHLGVAGCDEDDLYAAMDWVLARKDTIEKTLAARHLSNGTLVLYAVSSAPGRRAGSGCHR
jgi:hypothetical protein